MREKTIKLIELRKKYKQQVNAVLAQVIEIYGGQKAMARELDCTYQSITMWRYRGVIPVRYVMQISDKTGFNGAQLRPDLF
jgi:hypothetical protein